MLIDTVVIIWYMRGKTSAHNALQRIEPFELSAVTYMDWVQGMRNRKELASLEKALEKWRATVLPIKESISNTAVALIKQFFLSHSLQLADALVAWTALESGSILFTANDKHYRMVEGLNLQIFRP